MKKLLFFFLFIPLVFFGQKANEYFESGKSKLDLENYKGALEDLSKAIEIDSNHSPQTHYSTLKQTPFHRGDILQVRCNSILEI